MQNHDTRIILFRGHYSQTIKHHKDISYVQADVVGFSAFPLEVMFDVLNCFNTITNKDIFNTGRFK